MTDDATLSNCGEEGGRAGDEAGVVPDLVTAIYDTPPDWGYPFYERVFLLAEIP
jgi:hypothetical protein